MERAENARLTLARLFVVLCAVALCSGDLFRGFHLLTTRHVVCAEHGELVHTEEAALPHAPRASGLAAAAPSGDGEHHHDHCDLAATRSGQSAAILPGAALTPRAALDADALRPFEPRRATSCDVLSYAPKTSPPV